MHSPSSQIKLRGAFTAALSALGIVLSGSPLQAANKAWSTNTPGPANGNFSGTNWTISTTGAATPTSAAATGDALFFDTSAITTLTNDLTGATFAGITFNSGASAYTIGGNAFTLSGNLTNNSSSLQTFSNNITFAAAQTVAATGNITLNGTVNGAGTSLTKSGAGTLTLGTGSITMSGSLRVSNGTIAISGGSLQANSFSFIGDTANQTGVAKVASGAALTLNNVNGGGLGYASLASGSIYNSGTLTTTQLYMSDTANNGSYGYIRNTGTMTVGNSLQISRGNNASLLDIVGGTTTLTPTVDGGLGLGLATGSAGLNISSGGTFTLGAAKQAWINQGAGAYTSINITGSGSKLVNPSGGGFDLGKASNSGNLTTLTLSDGGELDTQYMFTGGALSKAILNFNSGTLKATAVDGNGLTINTGAQGSLKTYIYSGGATVDTNGLGTSGSPIKMGSALLAPTGNGITNIALGGTATGYVGAPIVKITGGGGEGAAAIANFDPSTGTITSITITSPGSGYTSAPTITLVGGNGGSTGAGAGTATATATIAAVAGGGLTKIGTGTLSLTVANTFNGPTKVTAGTLALANVNALQKSALDLTGAGAFTFTVAGTNTYNIGGLKGAGALTTGANSLAMDAAAASSLSIANATVYQSSPAVSVTGTGTVTFNSTLSISVDSLLSTGLHTFDLFGGTATLAGGFTTVSIAGSYAATLNSGNSYAFTDTSGNSYSFSNSTGDLSITVAAIPEPATYAALCGALALGVVAIRRRRKAGV